MKNAIAGGGGKMFGLWREIIKSVKSEIIY